MANVKDRIPTKEDIEKLMAEGLTNAEMAKRFGMTEVTFKRWKGKYGLYTDTSSKLMQWVKQYPDVVRAYGSLSKGSQKQYYSSLRMYCTFCNAVPDELWREDKEHAQNRVIDYLAHLKEKGIAPNTVHIHITAIRRFYEYKDITFKSKFIKNYKKPVPKEENEKELIEPHKLRELIEISAPMEKAMFMTQYQSGLSIDELCRLKVKHVGSVNRKQEVTLNVNDGVITLKLTREKNTVKFITFIGTDAIKYLDEWIAIRQRGHALKDKEIAQDAIITNKEDYLFVGYSRKYNKWVPTSTDNYAKLLRHRTRQLGWISDENLREARRFSGYRSHALRMSFSDILKRKAKVQWDYVEYWMGHTLGNLHNAYTQFDEEDMRKAYKEAEPYISLTPIEPMVTDDQYRELKAENEGLKRQLEEIRNMVPTDLPLLIDAIRKDKDTKRAIAELMAEQILERRATNE